MRTDTEHVSVRQLVKYIEDAHQALEEAGEDDSALRFELLADYLRNGLTNPAHLKFQTKHIGL